MVLTHKNHLRIHGKKIQQHFYTHGQCYRRRMCSKYLTTGNFIYFLYVIICAYTLKHWFKNMHNDIEQQIVFGRNTLFPSLEGHYEEFWNYSFLLIFDGLVNACIIYWNISYAISYVFDRFVGFYQLIEILNNSDYRKWINSSKFYHE